MKSPAAALAVALSLLATLGACERQQDRTSPPASQARKPAQAPKTQTPVGAIPPLAFKQAAPAAEVSLTLSAEIGRYPALHALLYDRETAQLRAFATKADADRKADDGQYPWRQYASERQWAVAAATPRLISLRGMWLDYTGGAHPNHGAAALLWDAAANKEVKPADLFRADADMKALDKAICAAVAAAKLHREGASPPDDIFGCPKWTETTLALAPSTEAGKIGGLMVLIDPYVVGPYAEGDYELILPLSAFRPLLAPTYLDAFAGSPKSSGNPDGSLSFRM
jgi:hypothetical protein